MLLRQIEELTYRLELGLVSVYNLWLADQNKDISNFFLFFLFSKSKVMKTRTINLALSFFQ